MPYFKTTLKENERRNVVQLWVGRVIALFGVLQQKQKNNLFRAKHWSKLSIFTVCYLCLKGKLFLLNQMQRLKRRISSSLEQIQCRSRTVAVSRCVRATNNSSRIISSASYRSFFFLCPPQNYICVYCDKRAYIFVNLTMSHLIEMHAGCEHFVVMDSVRATILALCVGVVHVFCLAFCVPLFAFNF